MPAQDTADLAEWRDVTVTVQRDHLARLARRASPIQAIAELIWNSLDADANAIEVTLSENLLGGLEVIEVSDNGTGMRFQEALKYFGRLGGSWKQPRTTTYIDHRPLHGKLGRGRFRAFGAGQMVEWTTRYRENGTLKEFQILADLAKLGRFRFSDPNAATDDSGNTGTTVRISDISQSGLLNQQESIAALMLEFAPYLKSYPNVEIVYNGEAIDTDDAEYASTIYPLSDIEIRGDQKTQAQLEIVEWTRPVERAIFFCDPSGVSRGKVRARIQAPGFHFTAYLSSEEIPRLERDGAILLDELHPEVKALAEAARVTMREHFGRRQDERASEKIANWKESGLYPYREAPANLVERAERQVFDVVALEVSAGVKDFDTSSKRSQSLSLRLLREAVATGPRAVHRILEEVLDLPVDKKRELARLLDHTSLEAIIEASKTVTNRLDFLHGLEILLFDNEVKKQTLERRQLHEILVDHTWVLGEQFSLTASDRSLNTVLRRHIDSEQVELLPVGRKKSSRSPEHNYGQRVDLMLARSIPQADPEKREYLIVELKRPSKTFDLDDLNQVKRYAYAVEADEAYKDTDTRWKWWGLANDFDDSVRREARQKERPVGLAYVWENTEIWVQTWAQVINGARGRLSFFRERLEYDATRSSAIEFLQEVHNQYLPDVLRRDDGG